MTNSNGFFGNLKNEISQKHPLELTVFYSTKTLSDHRFFARPCSLKFHAYMLTTRCRYGGERQHWLQCECALCIYVMLCGTVAYGYGYTAAASTATGLRRLVVIATATATIIQVQDTVVTVSCRFIPSHMKSFPVNSE